MAEKPFLAAAFLCERVLHEKDEVLTAVRIVDTFYVSMPKNLPPDTAPGIQATLLLSFRNASVTLEAEKHQLKLRLHSPTGQVTELLATPLDVLFKQGEVAGANVIITMTLGLKEFGICRLDVVLDEELRTCVPFRLLEKQEEKPKTIH